AASRATGTAATSSSASSVTAIMALADRSGVRSAYQPVITLTSQGPEPVKRPMPTQTTRHVVSPTVNAPLDQNHPAPVRVRGHALSQRGALPAATLWRDRALRSMIRSRTGLRSRTGAWTVMATVVLVGTLDTKGAEYAWLRGRV